MSHPYYYLSVLGVRLNDDQLNTIPAARFELITHTTFKTSQAVGLLGAGAVAPIVSLIKGQRDLESIQQRAFQYGKMGILTGMVLGPVISAAFMPGKSYDSIHDRCYRIRVNKAVMISDRFSLIGLAVGAGAAHYAGSAVEQGAVFGYIGGFLCGMIMHKLL